MKKSNAFNVICQNLFKSLGLMAFFVIILHNQIYSANSLSLRVVAEFIPEPLLPDSTVSDTTTIQYAMGDTIGWYLDGGDTVYVLAVGNESDLLAQLEKSYNLATDFGIMINGTTKDIQSGVIGVNLTNMFDHAPEADNVNYTASRSPWDNFKDLAPKTVRIFSGAGTKWFHPLGSLEDNPLSPYYNLTNGGYGIKLEEIVKFYDKTSSPPTMENPDVFHVLGLPNIYDDMEGLDGTANGVCDGCATWMSSAPEDIKAFEEDYREWKDQPHFNAADVVTYPSPADYPLAINEFIELIKQTEQLPANAGLTINVIYVANIWCATVTECKNVINYMRQSSLNYNYPVNVVGVEIGSEVFSKFHEKAIGFDDVCHYYDYITGGDYSLVGGGLDLTQVLSTAMLVPGAHDYLHGLNTSFEIQIGLPALNVHPDDTYPFKIAEDIGPNNLAIEIGNPAAEFACATWNAGLVSHYGDMTGTQYLFDAVILHTYYGAEDHSLDGEPVWGGHWGQIPICLDDDAITAGYQNFNTTGYDYSGSGDGRLSCAFDKSVSLLPTTNTLDPTTGNGNFRDFVKQSYWDFMTEEGDELHFLSTYGTKLEHPELKDVWITEANILNNTSYGNGDPEKARLGVFFNSTVHNFIEQGWEMNGVKANVNSTFRKDFMPYFTFQNFLGGTSLDFMNLASDQDLTALGIPGAGSCAGLPIPYYVARSTYHSNRQLNQIHLRDLKLLSATFSVYVTNPNLAPTVFITPLGAALFRTVYVYYVNYKNVSQKYILKPGTMGALGGCGTGYHYSFESPQIYTVNPDQLFSSAGDNTITKINTYYNPCFGAPTPSDHLFEIQGATPGYPETSFCPGAHPADLPVGSTCVTVPANSSGYFTVIIQCQPDRLGEFDDIFELYPNPTDDYFYIANNNEYDDYNTPLDISIFDMMGNVVLHAIGHQDERIIVSTLPVGVYVVSIKKEGHMTETEQLVKMH